MIRSQRSALPASGPGSASDDDPSRKKLSTTIASMRSSSPGCNSLSSSALAVARRPAHPVRPTGAGPAASRARGADARPRDGHAQCLCRQLEAAGSGGRARGRAGVVSYRLSPGRPLQACRRRCRSERREGLVNLALEESSCRWQGVLPWIDFVQQLLASLKQGASFRRRPRGRLGRNLP